MHIKENTVISANRDKTRLAQLSKGLAHPARVEIIQMLEKKRPEARCVCGDIVNALPLAQSSVSQHLKTPERNRLDTGGDRRTSCLLLS